MNDKECIEKMLFLHQEYREQYAETLENSDLGKKYFNILIKKSNTNQLEIYNIENNLYNLIRISNLEKEFLNCFPDGMRTELLEIWRSSILVLLTQDNSLISEFRNFVDIEEKIRSCRLNIEMSECLDRTIENLKFEKMKLEYIKNKAKKEKKNGK